MSRHMLARIASQTSTEDAARRTYLQNQERSYIAASRRQDRTLEARIHSAHRASAVHRRRTGRPLRITREIVEAELAYEEVEEVATVPNTQLPLSNAGGAPNAHQPHGSDEQVNHNTLEAGDALPINGLWVSWPLGVELQPVNNPPYLPTADTSSVGQPGGYYSMQPPAPYFNNVLLEWGVPQQIYQTPVPQFQGSQSQGSQSQRSQVQGSQVQGSQFQGFQFLGFQFQGSQFQASQVYHNSFNFDPGDTSSSEFAQ